MLYIAIALSKDAAAEVSDDGAYFFGFMGIASALVFASNISHTPVIYLLKIWDQHTEPLRVELASVHSLPPLKDRGRVSLMFVYQLLWPVSWVFMAWLWVLFFNKRVIPKIFILIFPSQWCQDELPLVLRICTSLCWTLLRFVLAGCRISHWNYWWCRRESLCASWWSTTPCLITFYNYLRYMLECYSCLFLQRLSDYMDLLFPLFYLSDFKWFIS